MYFSNQNIIPSSRKFHKLKHVKQSQCRIKNIESERETTVKRIANGDFDDNIIENYKNLKLDLLQSVSGAKWEDHCSSYRQLAKNLGLNEKDDTIIRELYRVVMYNKRFIRDRLSTKKSDTNIGCVIHVEIPLPEVSYMKPPFLPEKLSTALSSTDTLHTQHSLLELPHDHSPINIILQSPLPTGKFVRGPQPMSQVKVVDWGIESVIICCPRCHYTGDTKIQFRIGTCTWIWVVALVLSGICMPCSWFPCALNGSKDTLHICSRCLYILGRVPRTPCLRQAKLEKMPHDTDDQKKSKVQKPIFFGAPKLKIKHEIKKNTNEPK